MKYYRLPFDPELLTTFLAVAEAGRISAAAKVLNISQPSATAHLQKLEESLNTQLFERSVSGVSLTPQGLKLLEKAKKIQILLEQTAEEIGQHKLQRGHLKISASTTIAAHVLPPLLGEFRRRFSQITLELEVVNTEEVLERVRTGRTPLGLVEGHTRAPSVHLEPFIEDELVLVSPLALTPLIRKSADLQQQTLLMREQGSGTRAVIERALRKSGLKLSGFKDVVEIGSSEAIKTAVIAGLGVSFLSRSSLQNEIALGKLAVILLGDLHINRTFNWALPSGGLNGPAAEFYKFAQMRV